MKLNTATAAQFLETLDQIHLVAISATTKADPIAAYFTDIQAAIDWATPINSNEYGIYWTANAVPVNFMRKPSKANIAAARFAYVDIDPPKTGGAFDRPSILAALESHDCPPSFVIDSGNGLQAFWRLCEDHADLAEVESINRQLRDYYDADPACWNIDRLMRLPGSVNWPTMVKKARGRKPVMASVAIADNGLAYWPKEIAVAFPATKPQSEAREVDLSLANVPGVIARKAPADLGIAVGSSLYDLITSPIDGDRSGAGLRCVRMMAYDGFSDAEIAGILANGDLPISGHYIDQQNTKRAITRAIATVRADIPEGSIPDPSVKYFDLDAMVANAAKRRAEGQKDEPSIVPALVSSPSEPNWLRGLGGPLRGFVEYVTATAPSPQPLLALGAGLTAFGAIAGRRYAGPTDLRTNLYCIGIADSGGGKDYPLKSAASLIVEAGMHHVLGGAKIASGPALITSLKKQPNILYTIDEIGFLLSAAANRLRSPKYILEIMDNMTEFYSMSDSKYLGTDYADQEERPREVIEQPCLCMFGVTTPNVFWSSLSSGNVGDGSLARMIILESENNYPDPQEPVRTDIPVSLVLAAQAIGEGAEGHNAFPLGEHSSQRPKPFNVPYASDDARDLARKIRLTQTDLLRAHEGTAQTSIIARLAENSQKLALIKAICDNPKSPRISASDLEWGYLVAGMSVDTLLRAVKERVADNEQEAKLKRVYSEIAKSGAAGISKTELSRACKFMGTTRALNDVIAMLTESDMIRAGTGKENNGRKPTIYYDIATD